jgi:RNA polymerase sigma-70 factor (ECF subfamily)
MTEKERIPESLIVEVDHEQRRKAEIVRKAIEELPERQRIALVLSKYEGRTYKEIAEMMKASVSSIESLIFRAKSALREKLLPLKKEGRL